MKKFFLLIFLIICANFIFAQNPASFSKVTCPLYKIANTTTAPVPSTGYLYAKSNHLYWGNARIDTSAATIDTTHFLHLSDLTIGNIIYLQDSLNDRYRKKDTASILLSRTRASHDYEPKITTGTTGQYWRGDKTWQTLPTTDTTHLSDRIDLKQNKRANIKYFIEEGGIRNNSGIDNTTSLNTLITDLSEANGGIIVFDTGNYYFKGTVLLKAGVTLQGISTGTPVGDNREVNLYHDPTVPNTNFIEYDTLSSRMLWGYNVNTAIENLSINGSASSHVGINVMKAYRTDVKNVNIIGFDENIAVSGMMFSKFSGIRSFESRTTGLHIGNAGSLGVNTSTVFDQCYFGHTTSVGDTSRPIIIDPASALGFDFYSCLVESAERGVKIGTRNFVSFYSLATENIPNSSTATAIFEIGKDTVYKVYAGIYNFIGGYLTGRNGTTPYGTSVFDVDYCANMKVDGVQFARIDSIIKLTENSHGITFTSCGMVQINAGLTECNRLNSYNLIGNFMTNYNIDVPNYLKVLSDPNDTLHVKRAAIIGNDTISPTATLDVCVTKAYGGLPPDSIGSDFMDGLRVHDGHYLGVAALDLGIRTNMSPTYTWIQSRINNNYAYNLPLMLNPGGGTNNQVLIGVRPTSPHDPSGAIIKANLQVNAKKNTKAQFFTYRSDLDEVNPSDSTGLWVANDGKVGIGLTNPSSALDVGDGVITTTEGTSTDWDEAYGWGNHADAGYLVNPMSVSGDMIYMSGGSEPLPIRLAAGTPGQVLSMVASHVPDNIPKWTTMGTAMRQDTARGQPWLHSGGNTIQRNGGSVGIGTTAPATELQVASTSTGSPRGIMSSQHNAGTDGARLHMRKSRGTNASPTVITSGDMLGKLVASGYDGSNYLEMATIEMASTGTIGTNRIPTYLAFSTATDASPSVLTERMRITAAGNVGIGTTSPSVSLDVIGGITASNTIITGRTQISSDLILGTSSTNGFTVRASGANGPLIFHTGGSNERMRILSTGLVGIGTTAPTSLLHVQSLASSTSPFWASNDKSGNGDSCIYMNAAGNVGIGTTAPVEKLNVNGSIRAENNIYFSSGYGYINRASINMTYAGLTTYYNVDASVNSAMSFGTKNTEAIRIDNSQRVGIGTTAPASKLHVAGNKSTADLLIVTNDATLAKGDSSFSVSKTGSADVSTPLTTVNGSTSGTFVWSMPFQGTAYKKVAVYFNAVTDAGTTITYPIAFTNTPYIYGTAGAIAVLTTNTTTLTIAATTAVTGWAFVEGY